MKQQSIKNLIEIIDTEIEYEEALRNRLKNIKTFSSLGPPDMCYLTKQFKIPMISLGQKQSKIGSYHYVQGLNASTPACISAYINGLISQQEENNSKWFSNGEWVITKGYYCIFDAFSRTDVHIEVSIPGQMKLYGFTKDNSIVTVNDKLWEKAYVSSILRALNPISVTNGKLIEVFQTKTSLEEFLKIFFELIKENDIPLDENEDLYVFKYNGSKALGLVTDYLFENKQYLIAFEFLNSNLQTNPKCIIPLTMLYIKLNRHADAMKINAFYLIKYPTAATLLYLQAQCLLKKEKFQESYLLAKILCTQLPHNFDSWFLLSEIFMAVKNYSLALIALNIASEYTRPKENIKKILQEQLAKQIENKNKTLPKQQGESEGFVQYYVNPDPNQIQFLKINKDNNNSREEDSYIVNDINEKHQFELMHLLSNNLSDDEKLIYDKLVDIIKDISWDSLIKKRGQIFILDSESHNYNLEYKIENDFPNLMIEENKQAQKNQFKKKQGELNDIDTNLSTNLPNIIQIDENDYSDGEENDLPIFLKDNQFQYQNSQVNKNNKLKDQQQVNKKRNSQTQNKKFNQVVAVNKWEPTKNHITEKTEDSIESERKQQFLKPQNHIKKKISEQNNNQNINSVTRDIFKLKITEEIPINKRLCGKTLDLIFEAIYQDMGYLQKWNSEIKQGQQQDKNKSDQQYSPENFTAQTWLLRAALADRLKFRDLSIQAYQNTIQKSYCLYAWQQLMRQYREIKNFKIVVISFGAVIDELEALGVKQFNSLPKWISTEILNLIQYFGVNNLHRLLQEQQIQNDIISKTINQAIEFKVNGAIEKYEVDNKK